MFKFPLAIPIGKNLTVTQGFKDTALVEFYKTNGVNINSHEAIDVTCGTSVETYGTPLVCPFPSAVMSRHNVGNAEQGLPSFVQLKYTLPTGEVMHIEGVHLSGIVLQESYREGDTVGYLGNYGLVLPKPTIGNPYAGSHLHFVTLINGKPVNPLDHFDVNNPFRAPDTGVSRDIFAIKWAIREIRKAIGLA